MARSTQQKEERKLTLPSGHAQAGYISPDLSLQDGVGVLPDAEQEWHDERDEARDAEVEAVTANEDKVAKEEVKQAEAEAKAAEKEQEKTEKTTSTKTS
jgi:hypothetical protein